MWTLIESPKALRFNFGHFVFMIFNDRFQPPWIVWEVCFWLWPSTSVANDERSIVTDSLNRNCNAMHPSIQQTRQKCMESRRNNLLAASERLGKPHNFRHRQVSRIDEKERWTAVLSGNRAALQSVVVDRLPRHEGRCTKQKESRWVARFASSPRQRGGGKRP